VPESDRASDRSSAGGYTAAQAMAEVLRRAGDDLTRANIMKIVSNIDHWTLPIYLPGISLSTSPDNLFPMRVTYMKRYNGTRWDIIGKPISESE
jgi:branched-chain amino acid transport system substrate-binding protein